MADRLIFPLSVTRPSNSGGPYTANWDTAVVSSIGTVRQVVAVGTALASNTITNKVDLYRQPDGVASGSNTATSMLVQPLALGSNSIAVTGEIRASNSRVGVGDVLQLRTSMDNVGSQPGAGSIILTVEIERD